MPCVTAEVASAWKSETSAACFLAHIARSEVTHGITLEKHQESADRSSMITRAPAVPEASEGRSASFTVSSNAARSPGIVTNTKLEPSSSLVPCQHSAHHLTRDVNKVHPPIAAAVDPHHLSPRLESNLQVVNKYKCCRRIHRVRCSDVRIAGRHSAWPVFRVELEQRVKRNHEGVWRCFASFLCNERRLACHAAL